MIHFDAIHQKSEAKNEGKLSENLVKKSKQNEKKAKKTEKSEKSKKNEKNEKSEKIDMNFARFVSLRSKND
jgi:hypothetical protein